MLLLKAPRNYIIAFVAYAANAFYVLRLSLWHGFNSTMPMPQRGVLIPSVVGVSFFALILPALVKDTSSAVERAVILLTEILLILYLAEALYALGFRWALVPLDQVMFTIFSCGAALLAGLRMLQVMRISQNVSPK